MREVMEQSSDKVLENALANGGESHTVTHTSMQRVLITSYRNSLSKCIEAPGDMHIRMRLIDTLTEVHIHVHTQTSTPTQTFTENTAYTDPFLYEGSRTDQQLNSSSTQIRLTTVFDHFPPSDHSTSQRAILSPLKSYLKSLRGIASAGYLIFVCRVQ